MSRLLKALSLTLALASLSIFAISCGSSSSQLRVVDAIPDAPVGLDIQLAGKTIFTDVTFEAIEPNTGYQKVSSGSNSFEAFQTGTTTPVINSTSMSLGGSSQYTAVMTGFYADTSGINAPAAILLTDNNAAPTAGNIEFRIVDASPSAPTSVDVYIVPPGTDITTVDPQVSGLTFQQASSYQSLATAIYAVIVTPSGNKTPFINQDYTLTAGQIRTLVLVDVNGGGAISPTPVELSDLN